MFYIKFFILDLLVLHVSNWMLFFERVFLWKSMWSKGLLKIVYKEFQCVCESLLSPSPMWKVEQFLGSYKT